MRILGAVVVGVVAVACSSSGDGGNSGPCAQRIRSYRSTYVERSGTCGPPGELISSAGPQPTAVDAPCTGSISYTPDNCEVTFDSTCPEEGVARGAKLRENGKARWNTDATSGTATLQWTITDAAGKTICISTYDVTLTAL